MSILTKLFRLKDRPERSKGLVKLTDWERKHIEKSDGSCPDCGQGKLLQGAEAGCAMNVLCDLCGAKFNLALGFGGVFSGERIGVAPEAKAS